MTNISNECLSLVQNTAHTLIAGTTGAGKSVLLNSIMYSLIKDCEDDPYVLPHFYLVDTKRIELKLYRDLADEYVTEPDEVPGMLDEVLDLMEDRYDSMEGKEYYGTHVYIVIDELADLLYTDGVLERIVRIGRLGRAARIHLLMCTQDPSRHTLTAQIMQNMTTCVALRCKDVTESKQIIRTPGAETLPKHGKAIVSDQDGYRVINIPLTPDEDIRYIVRKVSATALEEKRLEEERTAAVEQSLRKASLIEKYGHLLWKYRRLSHTNPARGKRVRTFYSCAPIR